MLTGRKSYIVGSLIVLFGLLGASSTIPQDAAEQIVLILLGILGITLRLGIAKAEK